MSAIGATKSCSPWRHALRNSNQQRARRVNPTKNWMEIGAKFPPFRIRALNRRRIVVTTAQFVTYSSTISTDIPLFEPPGVSFDEYIHDRPRVFNAMFPDQHRSTRINEEEWKIQMLPLQFLLLTVYPIVVMQIKSKSRGEEYPPSVPEEITSLLELQVTKWELEGLDEEHKPRDFSLGVKGLLYPKREGRNCRLKGHLGISISSIQPPALALIPDNILRGVAESVLRGLAEKMKRDVDVGLLSDFRKFCREKSINKITHAGIDATKMIRNVG